MDNGKIKINEIIHIKKSFENKTMCNIHFIQHNTDIGVIEKVDCPICINIWNDCNSLPYFEIKEIK